MIDQVMIALVGPLAVWLTQHPCLAWRRWACILGLMGQVFWFHTAYTHAEWGIFIASLFYSYAWLSGVRTHWLPAKAEF